MHKEFFPYVLLYNTSLYNSSCIIVICHRTVWNIQSLTFRNIQKYAIYFLFHDTAHTLKFFISIIHIKFQTITLQRFYNFYVARTNLLYIHFTIRKILRLIFLKYIQIEILRWKAICKNTQFDINILIFPFSPGYIIYIRYHVLSS